MRIDNPSSPELPQVSPARKNANDPKRDEVTPHGQGKGREHAPDEGEADPQPRHPRKPAEIADGKGVVLDTYA